MSFSDDEREQIRKQLIQSGREQLVAYGPKKTTISDITEPVGIATSTFYLFFDSKEELIGTILNQEREEFGDRIESELSAVTDGQKGVEKLFRTYAEWLEENEFIQQAFLQGGVTDMQRAISREELQQNRQELVDRLVPLIEGLSECERRPLLDVEPLECIGVMSTFAYLASIRTELDAYNPSYYENVKELHLLALSRGLTEYE